MAAEDEEDPEPEHRAARVRPTRRRSSSSSTRHRRRRPAAAPPTSTSTAARRPARPFPRRRRRPRLGDGPRRLATGLISRIKIMAKLDIAERRVPQDGRIGLTVDGRCIDIRVATLPRRARRVGVLRILDKDRLVIDLDSSGCGGDERDASSSRDPQPNGVVLVTGPTGSGKTTTLYAALGDVNTPDKTHHHDRGPGRVRARGRQADAGQPEGRPDLRRRPARDAPRRPRRHHGRRDPRPRDRADRDRVGADRPPRPLHPAHQRRADARSPA